MYISNLSNLGFSLANNSNAVSLSINVLKRIEVDRTTVTLNSKEAKRLSMGETLTYSNPFVVSDDEDTENDSILLEHLAKEISDVGFDDLDLGTKIDLMVTGRKI